MNDELFQYVRQAIVAGAREQQILQHLLAAGYRYKDITETFEKAYEDIDKEIEAGTKDSYTEWLKKYFIISRFSIAKLIGLDMIIIALSLLEPWPLKVLADSVFGDQPAPLFLEPYTGTYTLLVIIALTSVGLFILTSIAAYIDQRIATRLRYKLDVQIKSEMFNHIIRLPFYHKERLHKGDYITRLNTLTGDVGALILNSTSAVVESIFMIIGVLIVLLFINLKLTLVGISVVPFLYLSIRYFAPKIQEITEKIQGVFGETANHIQESVENAETIQSLTGESKRVETLIDLMKKRLKLDLKSIFISSSFGFINSFLVVSGTTAIMLIGGGQILDGTLSFGDLFIFINYMQRLYSPIERLTGAIANIKKRKVSAKRVFDVINDHQEVENPERGFPLHNVRGAITFSNVSLSYDDKAILSGVNLSIPAGAKIGFIGPSGGGKSSLLKMVSRFIPPTSGSVFVDNYDVAQSSLSSLRENITIVTQHPQLFSGTILDNVVMGLKNMPEQRDIEAAVDAANASEFIVELPGKIMTYIGESGSNLSGGQKQRVAIARGLLRKAPIMILDEPTSALDSASEQYIKNNLRNIVGDSTVLMITHKLSMLAAMDDVYVVEGGGVRNVSYYGGLENYLNYLNNHELN